MDDGEGVLSLSVDFPTRNTSDVPIENFSLRIWRIDEGDGGEPVRGLVRKYASLDEVPQYIWLMEGNYSIVVDAGVRADASFDTKYYLAEQDFVIVPSKIATLDLSVRMQNVPVEVRYDATIAEKMTSYAAWVSTGDTFDMDAAMSGSVPSLEYTQSATGYFILPEGCTSLCWYFCGEHAEVGKIEQSGVIADVQPQTLYSLEFKYSKDANGYVVINATLDTSADHREDNIPFSPDPQVKGVGFNAAEPYSYAGGERAYSVAAISDVVELSLGYGNAAIDLLAGGHDGIMVEAVTAKSYTITLSEAFFNNLPGGNNTLELYVSDSDGGKCNAEFVYSLQGVNPVKESDCDLWLNTAKISATVFGRVDGVQIAYREMGGEWQKFDSSAGGNNTFSATVNGIAAGRQYECALFIGDAQIGAAVPFTTAAGVQVPGAGFEEWMKEEKAWYPFSSFSSRFWDTGNPGATSLGDKFNLTLSSNDIRPGSSGKNSAYLHSAFPALGFIGKFAAGNIFVGEFAGVNGTNGLVDFGRPFTFNARPKAMKFWYKNYNGNINKGDRASGQDITKIFICLCDWTKPHRVDTTDPEKTTFDPSPEHVKAVNRDSKYNGIIGYGYMVTQEHVGEWTEYTLDIEYLDPTAKPNYLLITFTCSGHGDFFCGSTDSWMYVDDIELVY